LAQEKSQPPTGQKAEMEQRAIEILRNDPQMRTAFINQVAAPIANWLNGHDSMRFHRLQ